MDGSSTWKEKILSSKIFRCYWLLFWKFLLLPLYYYFYIGFLNLSFFVDWCWKTRPSQNYLSLSMLYSLTTILRSKQNWICRRSNNRLLYCRTFLGPFLNSHWAPSSFQSLWLMLSDQDVRLHHKTIPAPQAFYSEVIWFRWLWEHWEERLNTQGDS